MRYGFNKNSSQRFFIKSLIVQAIFIENKSWFSSYPNITEYFLSANLLYSIHGYSLPGGSSLADSQHSIPSSPAICCIP